MVKKHFLFTLLLVAVTAAAIVVLLRLAMPVLQERYRPYIVEYLASRLPVGERKKIYYRAAQKVGAIWNAVPDPEVGRIGQVKMELIHDSVEVSLNNAGMRSQKRFLNKTANEFRIVCLGDSFVFGNAGNEQDRFCNQIEAFYAANNITVDGKAVTGLALGLGSWTMKQQASYLLRRMSDYDPDIILVLSINNDISANSGVTGQGFLTNEFSPEQRSWGSGAFKNQVPITFGVNKKNLLDADLSPLSAQLWIEAVGVQKQLALLQKQRNKRILFSALETMGGRNNLFIQTYHKYFAQLAVNAPIISVPYARDKETKLPHDSHPNRRGHEIIAQHYIQALHQLGWIPLRDPVLAAEQLPLVTEPVWSQKGYARLLNAVKKKELFTEIDFADLHKKQVASFLGGIFPEKQGKEGLATEIWGTVRSGLLLKKSNKSKSVELTVQLPERLELYPMQLQVVLNGVKAAEYQFISQEAGEKILQVVIPEKVMTDQNYADVLEVIIYADKHFSGIEDHRMKSYKFVKIKVS